MRTPTLILVLLALPVVSSSAEDYSLETLPAELDHPWCVAFPADGGYLVTELGGTLKRLDASGQTVATIRGVPPVYRASQGGLFDIALHPDHASNGVIFLSYADGPANANATAVARAVLRNDELDELTVVFRVTPEKDTPVHYGGRLLLPGDGTLLLTSGDGFDLREAAQDLASQLGKVLRMTLDGEPAPGNPFPEAPYVYTYGHRNPQGLAATADGAIVLHEHGPRGGDEVNLLEAGGNYGWPAVTHGLDYSGATISPFTDYEGMIGPLKVWVPSIAPSGLAVYDGDKFAAWRGDWFVGALVDRDVRRLTFRGARVVGEQRLFGELDARIRDVRSAPDGNLYLLTDGPDGRLVRVTPAER